MGPYAAFRPGLRIQVLPAEIGGSYREVVRAAREAADSYSLPKESIEVTSGRRRQLRAGDIPGVCIDDDRSGGQGRDVPEEVLVSISDEMQDAVD